MDFLDFKSIFIKKEQLKKEIQELLKEFFKFIYKKDLFFFNAETAKSKGGDYAAA